MIHEVSPNELHNWGIARSKEMNGRRTTLRYSSKEYKKVLEEEDLVLHVGEKENELERMGSITSLSFHKSM